MRTVRVSLGPRSYDILIGTGLIGQLGRQCRRLSLGTRCAVISDRLVARRYARQTMRELIRAGFDPCLVTVPSGESSKSLKRAAACWDALATHRLERDSFVVALGGGVVGDLAGFVAATYLRGIAFVQVPTTLLAQVDSSVGGKVGVNLKSGKNLVGSFYQPRLVLCDLTTLETLPARELRAGLAEVIKYGVIQDAELFARLERELPALLKRRATPLAEIVARCCEIKAEVVGRDETEGGLRAILNFGHTIGHAIENSLGYGRYLHGEAIAMGQTAAAWISTRQQGLAAEEADRIRALLRRAGLPVSLRLPARQRAKLWEAMKLDKKVSGGRIRFVLADRIGRVSSPREVPAAEVEMALDQLEPGAWR